MKLNTLRPRRLRRTAAVRSMVRETSLEINDFIYPIFVVPGANVKEEIQSMPGCYHLSVDQAVKQAEEIVSLGIPAVEIFGLPSYKDDIGSRCGYYCSFRYDGRAYFCHPKRAGYKSVFSYIRHVLCGKVCIRVLRSFP